MEDKKAELGEQKQTQEGITQMDLGRTTLKIWDVPIPLAQKFIGISRSSYANKSWLLLQELMIKADKYDQWVSSGRLADIEEKLKVLDIRIKIFEDAIRDAEETQEEVKEEVKAKKQPKTFGD